MYRNSIIVLIAAAAAIAIAGFEAGMRIETRRLEGNNTERPETNVRNPPESPAQFPSKDEQLHIQNITSVPFSELYKQIYSASPEQRVNWAKQLTTVSSGPKSTATISTFYKVLVQVDPTTTAKMLESLNDDADLRIALEAVVGAAPQSAMEELAKLLPKLPGEITNTHFRGDYLYRVLNDWSRLDPAAAARFLEQHRGDGFSDYVGTVVENWAALNPEAAKSWLDRQDSSRIGPVALERFLSGWFQNDPNAAADFVVAHAAEKEFESAVTAIAANVFLKSPDEALAFMDRLPTNEAKQNALLSISGVANNAVDYQWRAPDTVANWLLRFPAELWRGAMSNVIKTWREGNAQAFFAWMVNLPPATRERVIAEYSFTYFSPGAEDVARDIRFAMTAPPDLRQDLARQLMRTLGSSRKEAVETLQRTDLPAAQKTYLETLIPDDSTDQD